MTTLRCIRRLGSVVSVVLIGCKGATPSLVGSIEVVSSPPGAAIILDGTATGSQTPDTLREVAVGEHELTLRLPDYVDWTDTVRVEASRVATVEAVLRPPAGALIVTSEPEGANVSLDGEPTGMVTPTILGSVPLGEHELTVSRDGFTSMARTVELKSHGDTVSTHVVLEPLCPGSVVGDTAQAPEITIVGLEPGDRRVMGIANNVDASTARVVLWARTDKYYVQPFINSPWTIICGDGSWENGTHPWNRMIALLVDSTYVPGATRLYHPSADPGVLAWDEYPFRRPDRVIDFAGIGWTVKYFETHRFDPGPNYWSDSASDVWVDGEGNLHLTTANRDGKWYSTEVFANEPLGYGEYTFRVSTRVDSLDYRAVFAGFVYETVNREIDIEFSRVLADPDNAQFVVQPYTRPGNILRWTMPPAGTSSHRFDWRSDRIEFTSWRGLAEDPHPDSIINSWTYTGPDIPPPDEARMRFNLWLFGGAPPSSGEPDEVVIRSFRHRP